MEKNFKYSININQFAVVKHGFKIDLIDCAIFDYLKDFAHCEKIDKTYHEGKSYFYIKWNKIVDDMPMIGINTRKGIIARINNLIENKLLERHPYNQTNGQSMFCFGENYLKMVAFTYTPVTQNTTPVTESIIPVTEKLQDAIENDDFEPKIAVTENTDLSPMGNRGVTDGLHYNSINYNSIKHNVYNSLKEEKNFKKKSELSYIETKPYYLSDLKSSTKFQEWRSGFKDLDNQIFEKRILPEVSVSQYSEEDNLMLSEGFILNSAGIIGCNLPNDKNTLKTTAKSILDTILRTSPNLNWSELELATEISTSFGANHPLFDFCDEPEIPNIYNFSYFQKVLKVYLSFRRNLDTMLEKMAQGIKPYEKEMQGVKFDTELKIDSKDAKFKKD